jgi:hypothetical protein
MLAAVLAVTNVWFAAVRSLIPLRLDAVVQSKEIRHEKHPPDDDVCLLDLGPRGTLQVDPSIYERVNVRDHLLKDAWSHELKTNDQSLRLDWSPDVRGMVWTMPLAFVVMLLLALYVTCR